MAEPVWTEYEWVIINPVTGQFRSALGWTDNPCMALRWVNRGTAEKTWRLEVKRNPGAGIILTRVDIEFRIPWLERKR